MADERGQTIGWVWDHDLEEPVWWIVADGGVTTLYVPGEQAPGTPWRLYLLRRGAVVPNPERDLLLAECATRDELEAWMEASDLP
jgi:hypothetical protein